MIMSRSIYQHVTFLNLRHGNTMKDIRKNCNNIWNSLHHLLMRRKLKQHMSSCKVYEDHHLIDESIFIEEQDRLLNPLEMSLHMFHDHVDFYIELYFSKVSNDPFVGMILDHSCKYPLLTNLLLQSLYHSKIILNNCMEGVIFISSILTWLH
jgi:hypothetical protein